MTDKDKRKEMFNEIHNRLVEGNKKRMGEYVLHEVFHPNRMIAISGIKRNHLRLGDWHYYDPDGRLTDVKDYTNNLF